MFKKLITLLAGAILLILGFMFSVVILALIPVLVLAAWGYLRWKSRKLGPATQEQNPEGLVIEGESVVVEEFIVRTNNILPGDPPGT